MDWSQNQIRLFRALLYCYPAEFRHEYGAEMEQLFRDRLESEPRLRVWLDAVTDLAFRVPREHWHVLVADVKYGARVLATVPGFTAIALLVIALGIGATTSVFSVVNAVLLRSLPYGHPEKLVYLWSPNHNFKGVPDELAPNVPDFYEWQRVSHSFSAMAMLRQSTVSLVRDGFADRVQAALVTGSFFRMLDVQPAFGRTLDANDDQTGHEYVAVISDAFWRSRFGSDPRIIGKQIQLNRERYTVIGVMSRDFGYPFDGDIPYDRSGFKQTDIWLPAAFIAGEKTDRMKFASATALGRLREGVSVVAAQEELIANERRLQPLYQEMWRGGTALVKPLVQTIVGPVEKMLWLLLGAVGIVLLIAVSNVANLLLARATVRAHELGIRTALGAERGRLIRQLLTESLMLSCAGGAAGIGLAYLAVRVLIRLNPGGIPRFDSATLDGRVLIAAVSLSIATGLASGLVPAISASRANVIDLLKRGSRGIAGLSNRGRFALIVLEVALSVILLAGSGLLIRSYVQLAAVDPGFSPLTLTFGLRLDQRYSSPEQQEAFYRMFLEKLANIPGAIHVGASTAMPLSGRESLTFVEIRGLGRAKEMVEFRAVTPGYRQALGTALLRGRDFDAHDPSSKTSVAIVNQRFAATYLQGHDPLSSEVRVGMIGGLSAKPWSRIVGVVGDIRHNTLEETSQPQIFLPADNAEGFAIQSSLPVQQVIDQVRAQLRSLDPVLTLDNIGTMGQKMTGSNARRRFQTALLTGFAAIAVVLALIGLYGLMSYTVKQRTAEIGVRLAVGSSRGRVLRLILAQGLRLTAIGLIIGLAGAFALTRLVSAWLFGVQATDPVTFIAVPLFVLVVACCACIIPAWSATRIDPIQALRQE